MFRPIAFAGFRRLLAEAEFSTLAAMGLGAGALLAFLQIADEVREGETGGFDAAILLALRNPADTADPIGPWWIETMFLDITSLGSTTVLTLTTLGALGYLLVKRKHGEALLLFAAVAGGSLVGTALKHVFARPRPELVAHLSEVHTQSFPSGHAMQSAVVFLTIAALVASVHRRLRERLYLIGVAVALTLLVGVSRIYLGVHYPTDVLAGWSAGAAWAMLCWLAARLLQRRGSLEPPSE
jgi:undecaprenyl-diphosphatase